MNAPFDADAVRLTQYSHGGGCGCKIAPAVLSDILANSPLGQHHPDLLVGAESSDDAAVYRLNDRQAIVATTDFFMPIVDDPFDFGRIAATNAISDVYAMGAQPILALAVVGMPIDKLPVSVIRRILEGGASVCAEAGVPVAGGHSIDAPEPIYGLVALGIVHPERVKRNDRAQAGDALVLGKPLGVGILSAALKKGELDAAGYRAMLETTTRLNRPGIDLADLDAVHALTDVTGFGLLGHLLEICRGSGVGAELRFPDVPVLTTARALAEAGYATGASARNWASYGTGVQLADTLPAWARTLLTDPQTSGGLLAACAPGSEGRVLEVFRRGGFEDAAVIGWLTDGPAQVRVAA
ncbi:MAG: selenide, water dikinase SelD [Pseudomonadota bacterium]